jgi:hypothetical protein
MSRHRPPPRADHDLVPDVTAPAPGDLFALRDAPSRPWLKRAGRCGRPPSYFTLVRQAVHGRRAGGQLIKLRTLMITGTRCTCDTWLREFFEAVTAATDGAPLSAPPPGHHLADHARAEAELDAAGVR